MSGGVYKRPKLNILGFSFCPQGPRLAAPQGTSTRGAGDLNSRRQGTSTSSANDEGPRLAAAWTSTHSRMFPPRNKSYFLRKERQEENRLFAWEMLGTTLLGSQLAGAHMQFWYVNLRSYVHNCSQHIHRMLQLDRSSPSG